MHIARSISLALAIALLALGCEEKPRKSSSGTSQASGASSQPAAPNAADLYKQAWARVGTDLNLAAGSVVLDGGSISTDPGMPNPRSWEQVIAVLQRNQAVIKDLIAAGETETCDWGLPAASSGKSELDQKPVIEASGKMRMTARLLRADALRAWQSGDADGAATRLKAMYQMVGHASREPRLFWALSNVAVLRLANETARALIENAPKLGDAPRRTLLDALNALDRADPSGLARARKAEGNSEPEVEKQLNQAQSELASDMTATRAALGNR